MRWIDSMMVWSHTVLNSGFRFWTNLSLGVQASDASDPLIVGYLLELSYGSHHVDVAILNNGVPAGTALDLRVVFNGIPIRGCS
jgi:hypothetical protein